MRWYLGFCAYSSLGWSPSPTNSCIEDNMYHHVQMLVLGALDVIIADVSARHLQSVFQVSTYQYHKKVGGSLLLMVHFCPIPNYLLDVFYRNPCFFLITGECQRTNLPLKVEEGLSNGERRGRGVGIFPRRWKKRDMEIMFRKG